MAPFNIVLLQEDNVDTQTLAGSELFRYVILPLLIFSARIVDVSLGTLRIIYLSRGLKSLAAVCAFFEILIWLIAITQIFQHISNFSMYIAWAGGFAAGNYVGIMLENKLAVGFVAVRVITRKDATDLIEHLRKRDYGVTSVAARGVSGNVRLVFTIIRRKNLKEVINIIRQFNPMAFFSIEDVRAVKEGVFPPSGNRSLTSIRSVRKAK